VTESAVGKYWSDFLATLPADSPYRKKTYTAEGFGDHPQLADELGQLVLSGIKTGTCAAVWDYEFEGQPFQKVGDVWIVLDGKGAPMCITETTEVTFRRYNEVDEDFARSEGEGDLSLQYWREAHKNFFTRILPKFGKEFTEDMPLVCERFKVIYQ
jgi:uncharacterized protein YhfF